jgi:hypothetical protein
MEKNNDGLGTEIAKLAEVVEILDNSFFASNETEIIITVDQKKFTEILRYLNYNTTDEKCIISIGNVNFTFLKK